MPTLLKALQQLDIMELEALAGQTIVRAVQGAYATNRERELAKLVIDRFGANILSNVAIRKAFIDRLTRDEALGACTTLGLANAESPHAALARKFGTRFATPIARQFVDVFGLDEALVPAVIEDDRATSVYIHPAYGEQIKLRGFLHPYQRRVKDRIRALLAKGVFRIMAQMPTGAGKTVTALEVLVDQIREPEFNGLIVWLVDSNELADQALEAFVALWKVRGDRPISAHRFFGKFTPDFATCAPGVVFAGFAKAHSALTSTSVDTRSALKLLSERTKLIVVDEAHTSVAETYETVIRYLTRHDAPLIGLTATPGRNDPMETQELARLYGSNLVSITGDDGIEVEHSVEYLRREGYLARIKFEELHSDTTVSAQDEDAVCTALAENAVRNDQILMQIELAHKLDEATIVFACTKDHVLALVALCRARALKVGFIIGEVSQPDRIRMLNAFRNDELKILINHEILSTGIDLPSVDRLIITRPVGSAILYSQMIGRALRGPNNGGNAENTIVNIQDNLTAFPSAAYVYNSFRNTFHLT